MAAIFAVGAVAGFAQDPCADADGQTKLGDEFRRLFALKDLPNRKLAIETGKQFVEKYGSCETAKELADYFKLQLPGIEQKYKAAMDAQAKDGLYKRFDASVKASNWDETYASGKEILAKEPDQLDVIISLGSIGYDESYKGNFKYNDDTLRFAKMAIAALDAGKTSKTFGLFQWTYKTKENALGWMNYTVGYITQVAQKNKKDALPYLFKATQLNSETNKNAIPYELIGGYYFDELNKLTERIQAAAKDQKDTDTPEVAKQKVDAIKALVALSNGTSERAMDAFSRAYALTTLPTAKTYKDKMYGYVRDAYKLRFAKDIGIDAWIAETVKKPLINPSTPVAPISDPEPVEAVKTIGTATGVGAANGTGVGTANGTGVGAANGTGVGAANGTGVGGTKPAGSTIIINPAATPAKPATTKKPGTKPQAVVKKPVVKKKGA